jgi:hypothetical protein
MGWRRIAGGLTVVVLAACASACSGPDGDEGRGAPPETQPSVAPTDRTGPIDWTDQPYPECGELPPTVLGAVGGDLDADGSDDAVVSVRCETVTAGAPNLVVAFLLDPGTGEVADREVLVTQCGGSTPCEPGVVNEHLVGDLDVTLETGVVTVQSQAYSPDAPLCCPDLELELRFRWSGQRFDQVPRGR